MIGKSLRAISLPQTLGLCTRDRKINCTRDRKTPRRSARSRQLACELLAYLILAKPHDRSRSLYLMLPYRYHRFKHNCRSIEQLVVPADSDR
ncbi:MAG: hypothetical protein F6J93_08740 [Oscillatoria sp. SIO1A7]|nr:hypothetical protein [Oscillatoria sp. SIO1A7]